MKAKAKDSYGKKGQDVVDMNYKAIDAGATASTRSTCPRSWANAESIPTQGRTRAGRDRRDGQDILEPVDKMDGDSLPVSAFVDHADGQFELGAAAYEKRGVAVSVPSGTPRSASSATSAPTSARTPPSVPSR